MGKDNRVTNSQMKRITRLPIGMMNKKTKMIKMEIKVMKDKMTMITFFEPKSHFSVAFVVFATIYY